MPVPHRIKIGARRAACACALASGIPLALAGHVQGSPADTAIGVYDSAYVTGGRTYTSLDELASAILSAHPASVLIVSCTPAASAVWLAAVPRFEAVPMHLDVSDGSSRACAASDKTPAAHPGLRGPDKETQEYWSRRMP